MLESIYKSRGGSKKAILLIGIEHTGFRIFETLISLPIFIRQKNETCINHAVKGIFLMICPPPVVFRLNAEPPPARR